MISLNEKVEDSKEESKEDNKEERKEESKTESKENIISNNILYYSSKNVKYYKSLYNLIFLYINELKNIKLDNIDYDDSFNQDLIKKIIKKIEKYNNLINEDILNFNQVFNIKKNAILNLLKLYKLSIRLYNNLNTHIQLINEIDIYDKKVLMSDTSKNNINKNKLHILDIYNNFIKHIKLNNNNNKNLIINIIKKMIISDTIDINTYINDVIIIIDIIDKYFHKNIEIIDLFILLFNSLLGINNILNDYLLIINENNKQFLLEYEYEQNEIKINKKNTIKLIFNKTDIKENSKENKKLNTKKKSITKSKTKSNKSGSNDRSHILTNNKNIVKTYNKFKYNKSFNSLEQLLLSLDINVKLTQGLFNKDTIEHLNKAVQLYENKYKNKLTIVILECQLDPILYDITKLVDNNIKIEKLSGINDAYTKKTNTIVESSNNIEDINIYISNIQKTYIINSYINFDNKTNNIEIDYETFSSKTILIHTYDHNTYNILYNNTPLYNDTTANYKIDFKDILPIIQNQPNYNVENYNSLIEKNILDKIESKNILDEYYKTIKLDIYTYTLENTLEIKNSITNDIGKKIILDFNYENKNIIVDQILNIIVDNISKHIKNKNKIEYDAETYMTYLSSVNSLISKFKKEIVDNYDKDFIDNIDTIVENIYNKILKINDNIIDKHYYTHII
jgi:hypothetical protein